MLKTMALVCAAMAMFSASGFGMHKAGWLGCLASRASGARQIKIEDVLQSEGAMQYRSMQQTSWRQAMTVR
jgi:hypothetical protein